MMNLIDADELLLKFSEADNLLADLYANARERNDDFTMDNIASQRIGLEKAIAIIRKVERPKTRG